MRRSFKIAAGLTALTLIAPECAGGLVGDVERMTNNSLRGLGVFGPHTTVESLFNDCVGNVGERFRYGLMVGTREGTGKALARIARDLEPGR
jgi:hypothetical protein